MEERNQALSELCYIFSLFEPTVIEIISHIAGMGVIIR